ncbi:helicase [Porphyromonas gulae]|uniref:ATP-dependent DNA helicase n=1 Tax=Porphyromonas gulae TaxID=111105 RepID=UPI00052B6000|nr:AAA family ATPase [Porphyromonas gulae]KGN74820.1 helicase [Porphyromonas gulae]KGO05059.1 helicase [Porphyromonas gulae]
MDNYLAGQILKNLPFTPTQSQDSAIRSLAKYLLDREPYSVFLLRGYAGTGKTQLIASVVQTILQQGAHCELLAPTGRAAKVLTSYTRHQAYTIHRQIYQASAAGIEEGGSYRIRRSSPTGTVFIVDESSMIGNESVEPTPFGSGSLLNDLLAYVNETDGCRLILAGDMAQLPPVGSVVSPALDAGVMETFYGLRIYECTLTEVVRQQKESAILSLATSLRRLLSDGISDKIKLNIRDSGDVSAISGAELIEALDASFRTVGMDETIIVSYSNKRALAYNLGIRSQVLYYEEELVRGDRLVVTRNNYRYCDRRDKTDFVANGEIVEILRLGKRYELYGFRFADATINLVEQGREIEARLLLDGLTAETAGLTHVQRQKLYDAVAEDYSSVESVPARRKAIREDAFFSALEVKYAYAITCHKAQGGQWKHVYVDMGMLSYLPHDEQLCRWLYTAVTRASERLYLVNTPKDMMP